MQQLHQLGQWLRLLEGYQMQPMWHSGNPNYPSAIRIFPIATRLLIFDSFHWRKRSC